MTLKQVKISSLVYMYVTAFNYNEYGLVDGEKQSTRLFFYVKEEQKENKCYDSAYPMSRLKEYFQHEYNKAMAFTIFQSAKGVNTLTGESEKLPEQSRSHSHECIETFVDIISRLEEKCKSTFGDNSLLCMPNACPLNETWESKSQFS